MTRHHPTTPEHEYLVSTGVAINRTIPTRAILSCLGCHWNTAIQSGKDPKVSVMDISECQDIGLTTIYGVLKRLTEAGVAEKTTMRNTKPGSHLILVGPTDSDLARGFLSACSPPRACSLQQPEA